MFFSTFQFCFFYSFDNIMFLLLNVSYVYLILLISLKIKKVQFCFGRKKIFQWTLQIKLQYQFERKFHYR